MDKNYALALAGGGAKGSYQIGVWKALKELGIQIDAIAGTSVGAINGIAIIQDELEKAEELWTVLDYKKIFNIKEEKEEKTIKQYIKAFAKNKGLDIKPLKHMLNDFIDENKIRNSEIDYAIVTVSLSDMKPLTLHKKDIPKGKFSDYVLASAAFPTFQSHTIDGKLYVDGGMYDNLPINALIDAGYEKIIAVDLSAVGIYRKVKKKDVELINIKNSEYLGGTLEFNTELAKKNILLGYYDARKAFKKNYGKKYYIIDGEDSILTSPLNEEEIWMLFDENEADFEEFMSNHLIKFTILRTLKQYTKELNEKSALIASAEIAAETLKIERLKEYTLNQLCKEIVDKYEILKRESVSDNPVKHFSKVLWGERKISFNNKSLKEVLTPFLIKEDELPSKFMLAAMPKLFITNLFIYLMLWRMESNKD